jgi:isopentenyl diphosphate isomerase/L-lactate dehydrogenase-like FMN-dependent dehydrogenase
MASGIDDEMTLRANRDGFQKFQLRPRRLIDVSKVDTSVDILGTKFKSPIMIAPTGGHKGYHEDSEAGVARAAKIGDHLQILSTQTTTSPEDVIAARGAPIWMQLYATNKFEVAKAFVQRAERAGCSTVAVTVDRNGGRNQETLFRLRRTDTRDCGSCHSGPGGGGTELGGKRKPMYDGVDLSGLTHIQSSAMTWDYLKRIRDVTKMKVVVKGLLAHEDAVIAAENGFDGIIVSNHGARSEDSGRSTIEALPEIAQAVNGRIPIFIDSGFRRGTDILKALALGANGVAIGRPYLWGLGAFGQPGVERVLELLRIELYAAMQQVGAPNIGALKPGIIHKV